jgi:hypothetical protein
MTLSELRERLAGLDEEKEQITATLAEIEDAATCRLEAARDSLARPSWYNPVHAEWVEDPDATHPEEWLTLAARPEEVRRAYNRFGARFTVDVEGELTLSLSLDLEEVEKSLQEKSIFWAAATP